MLRTMLTDTQWNKLFAFMRYTGFIYHKTKHRQALEGILYRMRTGIPWRDLPSEFGKWNSVFQRFNAWSKKGVLYLMFNWLSRYSDSEWLFIDGTGVLFEPISIVPERLLKRMKQWVKVVEDVQPKSIWL